MQQNNNKTDIMSKIALCRCNNCNALLYDENPKNEDAEKYQLRFNAATGKEYAEEFPEEELQLMENLDEAHDSTLDEGYYEEGVGYFWACPNCKTDSYLMDIE